MRHECRSGQDTGDTPLSCLVLALEVTAERLRKPKQLIKDIEIHDDRCIFTISALTMVVRCYLESHDGYRTRCA